MKYLFYCLVGLFLFTSCSPSLTPFSDKLKRDQGWDEEDLKKIQFYLSDNIVLWREINRGESKIEGGKIKVKNGREIEEIVFKKGTPGVLIFMPKKNRFAIAFEDSDDRYLMFGPGKKDSRYVLLASDWKRDYGRISYDDKLFYTDESSAFIKLLVDLKAYNKEERKVRTAPGRKIK